jgi:ubiquitin carboxyl-terminal hydrolase 4/11
MYLTLPLPVQRLWEHTVHWVPYDIEKPHLKVRNHELNTI